MNRITLFAESANGTTGISRYIKSLAQGLRREQSEIIFKLAVRWLKKVQSLDDLQLHYDVNPFPGKIQKVLRDMGCKDNWLYGETDVVHEPNYQLSKVDKGVKVILTVHDVGWKISDIAYGLTDQFIQHAEQAIQRANVIITPTECVKKDVVLHYNYNPENIKVIPHGVDKVFVEFNDDVRPLTLPKQYWLYVGAMLPRKNVSRTITALSRLNDDIPLVVVGPRTAYMEEMLKQAEEQRVQVIFLANLSDTDLKMIYRKCLGLIYVSLWEGFGLPIMEAAAVGVPVLTSNNTAMAEIGKNYACLVNPMHIADIVEGLKHIRDLEPEQREQIRKQGEILVQKYSWDKSVSSHISVYREVLNR
jgi:glycosyltransferase involved in cell wall biosynthesis